MSSLPGGIAPGPCDVPEAPCEEPEPDEDAPDTGAPQLRQVFASSASVWPHLEQNMVEISLVDARRPPAYANRGNAGQPPTRFGTRAVFARRGHPTEMT